MGNDVARRGLEWVRAHNPGARNDLWLAGHSARMYALGTGVRWMQPETRFVILTPGRSGSELLTDLLNSHPEITCDAEILRERFVWPERFVAGRAAKAALSGAQAYGFKIHCGHFGYQVLRERPSYVEQLASDGTQLILLLRENILAQAVSSTIANRTRWHWRRSDEAVFEPLELDPVEVLMMAFLFEESERYLQALVAALPHLTLTYEQDLMEPDAQTATARQLCERLGVTTVSMTSDHVRFTPRSLRSSVANYEAVAELIGATRFGRFLDYAERADGGPPAATKASPGATKEQSGATKGSPGATKGSPGATKEQSGATKGSPGVTNSPPRATKGSPGATKEQSGATKGSPGVTNGPPPASKGSSGANGSAATNTSATNTSATNTAAGDRLQPDPAGRLPLVD